MDEKLKKQLFTVKHEIDLLSEDHAKLKRIIKEVESKLIYAKGKLNALEGLADTEELEAFYAEQDRVVEDKKEGE